MAEIEDEKIITITCGSQSWTIDEALVCEASPVIAKMMNSNMEEAQTKTINHDTFAEDVVERMVAFMKGQMYVITDEKRFTSSTSTVPRAKINSLLMYHVDVYAIAEYYTSMHCGSMLARDFRSSLSMAGTQMDSSIS